MIEWVRDTSETDPSIPMDAETNLLDSELLDSMSLMGLIYYLERRLDTLFDFQEFDPIEHSSIRGLIKHCLNS